MPLVKCIPCFVNHALLSRLCFLILKVFGICSYDAPLGWTYAFPNLCDPEGFHGSYPSGISPGKTFNTNTIFETISEWKVMHWRSGSRPWTFVFMPMDPMYNLSWKLLVKIITPCYKFIWYRWIDPSQPWFRPWSFFFGPISWTS